MRCQQIGLQYQDLFITKHLTGWNKGSKFVQFEQIRMTTMLSDILPGSDVSCVTATYFWQPCAGQILIVLGQRATPLYSYTGGMRLYTSCHQEGKMFKSYSGPQNVQASLELYMMSMRCGTSLYAVQTKRLARLLYKHNFVSSMMCAVQFKPGIRSWGDQPTKPSDHASSLCCLWVVPCPHPACSK